MLPILERLAHDGAEFKTYGTHELQDASTWRRDRISFLHLPRTSISLSAMPPRKHNDMDIDSGDDAYLTDGDDDDYSMGKTKKGKGKASEKRASGKGKGKGASGDVSS